MGWLIAFLFLVTIPLWGPYVLIAVGLVFTAVIGGIAYYIDAWKTNAKSTALGTCIVFMLILVVSIMANV